MTLANLTGDPDLQNSFMVSSDAVPGTLAAKFVAQGGPQLRRVELQAKDGYDVHNGGAHPWSIENGTESTLLLFNHGSGPQRFTVSVSGSETWQKTYTLTAMQTQAISLRDLIESRTKDDKARVLPANLQSGEVDWFVPDSSQSSGRLLHTDRAAGMARNYSCGYSNLLCGANITVYNPLFAISTTVDFASATGITCTNGSPNNCNGQQTGTGNFSTTWTASNPSVASISGSNAVSNVYVTGNSGGTGGFSARLQSTYCSAGGGATASVQAPTSLRVVKTINNQARSCPAGYAGWQRFVMRAVVDQNSQDIKLANQQIPESFAFGQDGLGLNNKSFTTGTGVTDGSGQYEDEFSVCSTVCPGSSTTTATQSNSDQVRSGGPTYPLTNSTIQWACTNIKINGALTP